jgi:organic radical activating enzyme
MFYTLQGEGPFAGQPALFIRVAKCNLACGFCDTFFDDGDWMSFEEINDKISQTIEKFYIDQNLELPLFARNREMILIITGGEPMLQANLGAFIDYVQNISQDPVTDKVSMRCSFDAVQIESNGTLLQPINEEVILVVSPKCSEKNGIALRYLTPKEYVLKRVHHLKFILSANPESPYYTIPQWAFDWRDNCETHRAEIFVSPMNMYNKIPEASKILRSEQKDITIDERSTKDEVISFWDSGLLDMKANQKNHEYAAKYAMLHNCTLNLQMQLYASIA